jgi:hypothetical protein
MALVIAAGADHATFPHAPKVDVEVRVEPEMVGLDLRDLHSGWEEIVLQGG